MRAFSFALAAAALAAVPALAQPAIGKPAPEFSANDADGSIPKGEAAIRPFAAANVVPQEATAGGEVGLSGSPTPILGTHLPASAEQQPPEVPPFEIIVTGKRNLEEQVKSFIRALTPTQVSRGQIGRFEAALCPRVWGLTPEQSRSATQRIRAVAVAASIEVAPEDCRPNAVVLVTREKAQVIRGLARARPWLFSGMAPAQIRQLAETPSPVSAWQISQWAPNYVNVSRARAQFRPAAYAAAVLIDEDAVAALTVTQVADYAAMRLLTKADPVNLGDNRSTILTVMDAPSDRLVPNAITEWDLAFLRGLNAVPPNAYAPGQRAAIARHMREDLKKAEKDSQ